MRDRSRRSWRWPSARPVRALALAAALAYSAAASGAEPTEIEQARAFFVEGSERVRVDDWAGARDMYEKSLALKRAAITLYSLAMAEEHVGRLVEARDHYAAFLAEPPEAFTSQYRERAETALAALDGRLPLRRARTSRPGSDRAGRVCRAPSDRRESRSMALRRRPETTRSPRR